MTTNRLAFGINESIPHRNKYQGLIGSLNSVNPNLVLNNAEVDNMTTPDIVFTGTYNNIQVSFITGNTGYFNNLFVSNIQVTNLNIGNLLTYTGIITTATGVFFSVTDTDATFINSRINTLTGTNFSTVNLSTNTLNTVNLSCGTGIFGTLNTTNENITNATIANMTGTNITLNKLAITGGTTQFFLSTGGASLNKYKQKTVMTFTGIVGWTGTISHLYSILGNQATILFNPIGYAPMNEISQITLSALPDEIRPSFQIRRSFYGENAFVRCQGIITVNTNGTIVFGPASNAPFTSGAVMFGTSMTYNLD